MKPAEFWNCTYREAYLFARSNSLQKEEDYKREIMILDALGNKILTAIATKRPKNISLVADTFKDLFKEELNPSSHVQTIEEQVRILRSMK